MCWSFVHTKKTGNEQKLSIWLHKQEKKICELSVA